MAIDIEIRKDSRIIILNIPGKTPVRARSGSMYMHNSMELICCAYAACVGNEIWNHCHFNDINVMEFESFTVTMENGKISLTIQHPQDMTDELKEELIKLSTNCPVSKMLNHKPTVKFIENETPLEVLVDETRRARCCGG